MGYIFVIACGVLALLYGAVAARSVLSAPAGNARMQEIAAAVQEGAPRLSQPPIHDHRHRRRVIFVIILGWRLGPHVAIGFFIGAVLSGRGRLRRHERFGARQRPHRRGGQPGGMAPALDVAFKSGAITGMLVVGLGLLGVDRLLHLS